MQQLHPSALAAGMWSMFGLHLPLGNSFGASSLCCHHRGHRALLTLAAPLHQSLHLPPPFPPVCPFFARQKG